MTCRAVFCASLLLVLSAHGNTAHAQEGVRLITGSPVSGELERSEDSASIGDKIVTDYLQGRYNQSDNINYFIYNIKERFSKLTGIIGVPDNVRAANKGRGNSYKFVIKVDGRVAASGTHSVGSDPETIDVDVSGASSLRVELSAGMMFGNPVLEEALPGTPSINSPTNGGTMRSGDKVTWSPVQNAVSYSVQIFCSTSNEALSGGSKRYWSFQTTKPEFQLDAKDMPAGQYKCQVMAFDARRLLGKASPTKSFKIVRE